MTGSSSTTTLPHLPAHHVSRPRLLALVEHHCGAGGVVVLRAPAGFGKTALLAEWVRLGGTAGWLRPAAGPGLAAQVDAALAVSPRPARLVVDEVDGLDATDLCNVLDVVRRQPRRVRCVLAGRRLDAEGAGVSSVSAEQLAFTPEETATFLAVSGVVLDGEQARRLHRRTGGSPAGLQLAALCLQRGADPALLLALLGDGDGWTSRVRHDGRPLDRVMMLMLSSERSLAQIADDLHLSVPVARGRMHAAYAALGTSSRRGAVLAAREKGLFR